MQRCMPHLRILSIGILVCSIIPYFTFNAYSQNRINIKVGAYYFDGWTGQSRNTITEPLKNTFNYRKPIWGWITSTPSVMQQQIDLAADAGLKFFDFCWYYPENKNDIYDKEPLNHALQLYLNAPNKSKLQFTLLIANHKGYQIGADEWSKLVQIWVQLFKDPYYLRVNGKPYITFFSVQTLVQKFGSEQAVKDAFNSFRWVAKKNGLFGVTIAACLGPGRGEVSQAAACGFDVLTGYNYSPAGLADNSGAIPLEKMQATEQIVWDKFLRFPEFPYVPLVTLNWDPRPWASEKNQYNNKPYFVGYSSHSVYNSVRGVMNWMSKNPNVLTKERLVLLYAWNEYGEGAYLTPTAVTNSSPYNGLKQALKSK